MKTLLRSAVFIVTASFLVVAYAGRVAAQSGDARLDKAVRKANDEWAAAMKTGDAAVIAAPYADDGVFVAIDGTCIKGRVEVQKMYRERFEHSGFASSTKIDSKKLVLDGDLAYETGFAEIGVVREGKLTVRGSRYLTVWQRQADGDWKIMRNVVLP